MHDTPETRAELLELLEAAFERARETVKNSEVLPNLITENGEACGVTISFHEYEAPPEIPEEAVRGGLPPRSKNR